MDLFVRINNVWRKENVILTDLARDPMQFAMFPFMTTVTTVT